MTRTFDDRPAVREKTPLLIGIVSPSGAGKTMSALRLATGIQRVTGGDIGVIDTEARRALHYADKFRFRHLPFGAPFSPLDYLAAIEHFHNKGVGTIVVDSTSHEHEGPGGVLEMHEAALDRMAGNDFEKRERMNMLAWSKPKQQRRKLINTILQMSCNFIFCFRAKEKMKMVPGKKPVALGFQAISGDEWIYEMTLKCLLLPGANGIPTWRSEMPGEQQIIKLPEQFRSFFANNPQLSEDIGQQLAAWAAGSSTATADPPSADALIKSLEACSDPATLRTLEEERGRAWKALSKSDKERVKVASDSAKERIERAARTFEETSAGREPGSDDENEAA